MSWFFDPLPQRAFGAVVIDPPWQWVNYTDVPNRRSPEARYRTLTIEEVAALPVRDLLAPGGIALVWVTWPLIARATWVIENAWGLSIRTGGAWAKRTTSGKLRWGTGWLLRSVCEPFVIARADFVGSVLGRREKNLIETFDSAAIDGIAREHSRKPDEIYDMVERMTPGWRRADIFARERRANWAYFGDQLLAGHDDQHDNRKSQRGRNNGRAHRTDIR